MTQPTQKEKAALEAHGGDSESYHVKFDELLESKLLTLDPEWIKAMTRLYEASDNSRWYA